MQRLSLPWRKVLAQLLAQGAFSTSQRGAQGRSSLSAMPRACFFACAREASAPPVVALRARAVRRGAWRLGRCVSGTATKRFPPLHARNRGPWIPDSSTAPDSVRCSSVRSTTHLRKASSDIRLKNALLQAASIPPDFSQDAAENARGLPGSVHSPPSRAGFGRRQGPVPATSSRTHDSKNEAWLCISAGVSGRCHLARMTAKRSRALSAARLRAHRTHLEQRADNLLTWGDFVRHVARMSSIRIR